MEKKKGAWCRVGELHGKEGFGAEQGDFMEKKRDLVQIRVSCPARRRCPGINQIMSSKAVPLAWLGRALPLFRLQLCHIKHNELPISSGGIQHYNNMNNK